MDWRYLIVQNSGTVEQRKVEQSSPLHVDVRVHWVVEDQGMESKDYVGFVIHKVRRKVWRFR